jgi:hypothetical protein
MNWLAMTNQMWPSTLIEEHAPASAADAAPCAT